MTTRATLFWVALAAILFMGCSMPQLGVGPSRALTGDQEGLSQGTAGSISVVMDETRGIAVFINENGARFDVAAEESPGGPLVKCIELADFTMVPQTGDIDSLPVKALVTGTREDGNPGVWEINADDTITLPEPEQNGTDPSRCIVGGVLTSLPDGMHVRFGWVFKTTGMSADGKIIVGRAEHRKGFSYNGVQVLPGSSVGVYWKVYRLPYSRFCIISPPRVLGTFVKEPMPAGWTPKAHTVPAILAQLKQFFIGRLEAYLMDANLPPDTTEGLDKALRIVEYEPVPGVYIVRGPDQDGKRAVAKINKNDSIEIVRVPDLHITEVTASPMAEGTNFTWDVPWKATVTVENLDTDGYEGMSTGGTLTLTLSLGGVSTKEFFHSVSLSELKPRESKNFTFFGNGSGLSPTDNFFKETTGPFTLSADVSDPGDFEEITGNNSGQGDFTVLDPTPTTNPAVLSVEPPDLEPPAKVLALHATDVWPTVVCTPTPSGEVCKDYRFTISNKGVDTATNVQLVYSFTRSDGIFRSYLVPEDLNNPLKIEGGKSVPGSPSPTLATMGVGPGTWLVTLKASGEDGTGKVTSATSAPVTLLVYYESLLIDTFNIDFTPSYEAPYLSAMQLFGYAGDVPATYDLWLVSDPVNYPNALLARPPENYPNAIIAFDYRNQTSRPEFDINFYNYSYIVTNLMPGDYYVRIYLVNNNSSNLEQLPYAIRLELTPPRKYSEVTEVAKVTSATLTGTGTNLATGGKGPPNVYQIIGIGQAFSQTLETGQVHWYKFTLP